jgi:3-dehydroquinate synthase
MDAIETGGDFPYTIHVGDRITGEFPTILKEKLHGMKFRESQLCILTDRNVARHHLHPLASALKKNGFKVSRVIERPGESLKSGSRLLKLLRTMVKRGLTRDSTILALGGGVIGDFAGFAASVYMRGCNLVHIPTTLLAQVDSSIGGKVGINLPEGKNLVGSFYSPLFVFCDIDSLHTLPAREFSSGFAEIVKYGLIWKADLFERLEEFFLSTQHNGLPLGVQGVKTAALENRDFLREIIMESARIKTEVVNADEREQGLRMILNFGHTFGHALEQITGYRRYLHGEAVFLGMAMAVELSAAMGLLDDARKDRVLRILSHFELPRVKNVSGVRLFKRMGRDKKRRGGALHFIVLEDIGKAAIRKDIPESMVLECIEAVLGNMGTRT